MDAAGYDNLTPKLNLKTDFIFVKRGLNIMWLIHPEQHVVNIMWFRGRPLVNDYFYPDFTAETGAFALDFCLYDAKKNYARSQKHIKGLTLHHLYWHLKSIKCHRMLDIFREGGGVSKYHKGETYCHCIIPTMMTKSQCCHNRALEVPANKPLLQTNMNEVIIIIKWYNCHIKKWRS